MRRSSRSVVWTVLVDGGAGGRTACSGTTATAAPSAGHRQCAAAAALAAARRGDGGGGGGAAAGPSVPPEIDGQLVINELMAANALTVKDESGAARPWIEILNPTDTDVPLGGYAVTDDFAMPGKGVIGDGVVVPAHGYLVLWLDGDPSAGPTHVAVQLSKARRQRRSRAARRIVHRSARLRRAGDRPVGGARARRRADVGDRMARVTRRGESGGRRRRPGAPAEDPETVPAAGDPSDRILGLRPDAAVLAHDRRRRVPVAAGRARHLRAGDADLRRPRLRAGRREAEGHAVVGADRQEAVAARQHRQVRRRRGVLRSQGPDAQQHAQRLLDDARADRLLDRAQGGRPRVARQPRAGHGQRPALRPLRQRRDGQEAHPVARLRQQHRARCSPPPTSISSPPTSRSSSWWPGPTIARCSRAWRPR